MFSVESVTSVYYNGKNVVAWNSRSASRIISPGLTRELN